MAITLIGTTSGTAVDTSTDNALWIANRPPAFGTLGAYNIVQSSGAIVATGSTNAVIWTMRWTNATKFALIERVKVSAYVASTITTGVPYDLALYFSTSYSVSPTTSITAATLTGRNCKRRTSMGTTLLSTDSGAGMWVLTTTAAGITGQTQTLDAQPLARVTGQTGTVTGTQVFGSVPQYLWQPRDAGDYPLILAQNEGINVVAPLAGPATGTFNVVVAVDWMEVALF